MKKVWDVIIRFTLLGMMFSVITGCSVGLNGDKIIFKSDKQNLEENLCAGMFEIEQPLFNGSGIAVTHYYQLIDGRKFYSSEAFFKAEMVRYRKHLNQQREEYNNKLEALSKDVSSRKQLLDYFLNSISSSKEKLNPQDAIKPFDFNSEPFVHSDVGIVSKTFQAPLWKERLNNIEHYFAFQDNPETCWAASLETAFRYIGYDYPQNLFLKALDNHCIGSLSETATVNQIFFAATDVHLEEGGHWIGKFPTVETLTIDLSNLISRIFNIFFRFEYQGGSAEAITQNSSSFSFDGHTFSSTSSDDYLITSVNWDTTYQNGRLPTEGGIILIDDTAALIQAIQDQYPVIVGLKSKKQGHTVIVSYVEFRPGGNYDSINSYYSWNHRVFLERVGFLDSTKDSELTFWSGDEFLSQVAFAFYIAP